MKYRTFNKNTGDILKDCVAHSRENAIDKCSHEYGYNPEDIASERLWHAFGHPLPITLGEYFETPDADPDIIPSGSTYIDSKGGVVLISAL